MPADHLQPLRDELGTGLPAGLATLRDDDVADLVAAIHDADFAQAEALDGAITHTLRFLPWPLSAVVRKILIG